MPDTLFSALNKFQPASFCQTPDGALLIANGLDRMRRWDGIKSSSTFAGIEAPTTAVTVAVSGAGSITGDYVVYVRYLRADGVASALNATAGTVTASSDGQVDYSDVPVSPDPDVTQRQIYRNTAGQTSTVYLDATIANNTATTATSTNTDAQLQANAALLVANSDASIPASGFRQGVPPNFKCYLAQHRDRIYAAGEVVYDEGHVELTSASAAVVGVGTNFTAAMVGRKFTVPGQATEYEVSAYTSATSITLTANFGGSTTKFSRYAIRPARAQRLLVYYTEIFSGSIEPESWPSTYSIDIPAPGGDITGLMPLGSFLFVLKQTAIFKISVEGNPAVGGGRLPALENRGCENNRCWCYGMGGALLLDREGVYFWDQGSPRPLSQGIQPLFRQINWGASKWFSAVYDTEYEVARFFVALGGSYLPTSALCYSTRTGRWWIEKHSMGVGSAIQFTINGRRRVLTSGQYDQHAVLNEGTRDLDTGSGGTYRGAVTAATLVSITDGNAVFASDLAGRPIAIIDGTGMGQVRRVSSVSSGKVTVDQPWLVLPVAATAATPSKPASTYQIGGFEWIWRGRSLRLTQREEETSREYQLHYEPTASAAHLFLRHYLDRQKNPEKWSSPQSEGVVYQEKGIRVTAKDPDIRVDMHRHQSPRPGGDEEDEGYKRYEWSDGATRTGYANRSVTTEMHGFSGQDEILIYELAIEGVRM